MKKTVGLLLIILLFVSCKTTPVKKNLGRVKVGEIFFSYKSYLLDQETLKQLDKIHSRLETYSSNSIFVEGHTDNIGSVNYNQMLSEKRAQKIANYLIRRGIPKNSLRVIGYGEKNRLWIIIPEKTVKKIEE